MALKNQNVQAVLRDMRNTNRLRHLFHRRAQTKRKGVTEAQLIRAFIRYQAKKNTAPNGNSEAVKQKNILI